MYRKILKTTLILILVPVLAHSQNKTGLEIITKANDVLNQETAYSKGKMTIKTTSGKTRELFYDSWTKGKGEKSLIRYTAPRRIKDQAMLMLNNSDDIWNYDPRTGRVRKLASHAKKQKMQGSDFSYEDMGSGDSFVTDFTHKLLKEEKKENHNCYVVEITKKDGIDSNYSRMITWVDKENYVIWFIDYYDEKDSSIKVKTLSQKNLKMVDNVPTPTYMTMHNHLDNTDTIFELLEVKYNIELDDKMFTERGLKK
jgi:outer membrane lipoprotein-sorting protein